MGVSAPGIEISGVQAVQSTGLGLTPALTRAQTKPGLPSAHHCLTTTNPCTRSHIQSSRVLHTAHKSQGGPSWLKRPEHNLLLLLNSSTTKPFPLCSPFFIPSPKSSEPIPAPGRQLQLQLRPQQLMLLALEMCALIAGRLHSPATAHPGFCQSPVKRCYKGEANSAQRSHSTGCARDIQLGPAILLLAWVLLSQIHK